MRPLADMVRAGCTWEEICAELGGTRQYISKIGCCHEEIVRRNKFINIKYRQLIEKGLTSSSAIQQLGLAQGLSDTTIRHILD